MRNESDRARVSTLRRIFRCTGLSLRSNIKKAWHIWFKKLKSNQRWGIFYIFEGIVCIILVTTGTFGIAIPTGKDIPEDLTDFEVNTENGSLFEWIIEYQKWE